jgi:hypothetical protein
MIPEGSGQKATLGIRRKGYLKVQEKRLREVSGEEAT